MQLYHIIISKSNTPEWEKLCITGANSMGDRAIGLLHQANKWKICSSIFSCYAGPIFRSMEGEYLWMKGMAESMREKMSRSLLYHNGRTVLHSCKWNRWYFVLHVIICSRTASSKLAFSPRPQLTSPLCYAHLPHRRPHLRLRQPWKGSQGRPYVSWHVVCQSRPRPYRHRRYPQPQLSLLRSLPSILSSFSLLFYNFLEMQANEEWTRQNQVPETRARCKS